MEVGHSRDGGSCMVSGCAGEKAGLVWEQVGEEEGRGWCRCEGGGLEEVSCRVREDETHGAGHGGRRRHVRDDD